MVGRYGRAIIFISKSLRLISHVSYEEGFSRGPLVARLTCPNIRSCSTFVAYDSLSDIDYEIGTKRARMVALLDLILLFDALIGAVFAVPHILSPDGNLATMGFELDNFIPSGMGVFGRGGASLPDEIMLCITHLLSIFGCSLLALVLMSLSAALSKEKPVKQLAIRVMCFYMVMTIGMQFFKPSGTGADGSPETGPLPVLIGLLLPNLYGLTLVRP